MKKFFVLMLAMLWMSVTAFSQITQEDYDKCPMRLELKLRR